MTDDAIHVPAQTPTSACRIAFLAEAPSTEELIAGKPLVGPSGRIFNAILRTAELNREDPSFWIGNVFDQKIPKNDIAEWCVTKAEADKLGWEPFPAIPSAGVLRPELRWQLDRLARDLDLYRPNIIVPLGATALWALTAHSNVSDFRGGLTKATWTAAGTKILPTFHPAHVMRLWKFFPVVVGDFIKADRESYFPELRQPSKKLWIEPSLGEVEDFLHRCMSADLLSVDIETGWGQITDLGFALNAEEAMCIPFVDLRKSNKCYWPDTATEWQVWQMVRDVLESPVPKLGQNFAGYDAFWLLERYGIKTMGLTHDTRLLHHALYPELPKDLAFMGGSYTNQGPWKHLGRKHEKRDD